ncbi:MAG: hypothetical protein EXR70_18105 [Deltaproteobacteria bacterium]|nr:hypothetical protein [Deltaproteobacteria bacterium]
MGKVLQSVYRSFIKPEKCKFNQALISSIHHKDIHTPAGLYLGAAPAYDVDLDRLTNVIRRTTLGMFAKIVGHRLPNNYQCMVYSVDGFSSAGDEAQGDLCKLASQALTGETQEWGNKVFMSWFQKVEGLPFATLWAHLVYSRVAFIAMTLPASNVGDLQSNDRLKPMI